MDGANVSRWDRAQGAGRDCMSMQDGEPQMPAQSVAASSKLQPNAQTQIILYSLFAALTRFIPLPIVDDMAASSVQQLMLEKIARAYGENLNGDQLGILSSKTGDFYAKKAALSSAMGLIKRIAIKTTIIFEAKDAADTFSSDYHIGYLLDYAYKQGWMKQYTPFEIRRAIDTVCDHADTSAVNHVMLKVLKESASILGVLKDYMTKLLAGRTQGQEDQRKIPEAIPSEAMDLVQKIQMALDLMPPGYFVQLRELLARELGSEAVQNEGSRESLQTPDRQILP